MDSRGFLKKKNVFVDFILEMLETSKPSSESSDTTESEETTEPISSADMKPKRLLGAKQCSFGPSYWCSSKETMIQCKVSIQCQP